MQLVHPDTAAYARAHTTGEPTEAAELIERSDRELDHIDMLSGRVVGQLLAMLVRISGARRVLEIGTFTGYSALRMAQALPAGGELITCEYNRRYETLARSAFGDSDHAGKITLKMGPALETIAGLEGIFGLIYLDADKKNYPRYYEALLPLLPAGGLLVVDNVLWNGKVLSREGGKAKAIDRMNRMIRDDDRVEQVMLTVRDGVTIVRKI